MFWQPSSTADFAARAESAGKKVSAGFHPLADSDGGVAELSTLERRQLAFLELDLPFLVRNGTSLQRDQIKKEVLNTYTTTAPISSFITLDEDKMTEAERLRARADRLGGEGEAASTAAASGGAASAAAAATNQSQLIQLIEGLDAELKQFWGKGEKVRALRVAIQATKMLSVSKMPQCYPSVFVLVATVLDSFGDFVAERLQSAAAGKSFVLAALLKRGMDASADLIPPEAIEMCNNWFLKISSIRELLPRICVELSLLKSNKYLARKARVSPGEVVRRLASQIRGVADPLVAAHLRWYLFMRAGEVMRGQDEWASILETACLDNFRTMEQLQSAHFEKLWIERDLTRGQYLSLFTPALQWQLDTVMTYGRRSFRPQFLQSVLEWSGKFFKSAPLLLPVLRSLNPADALQFGIDKLLEMIDESVGVAKMTPRVRLYESMGLMLAELGPDAFPWSRSKKSALLSSLWGRVETELEAATKGEGVPLTLTDYILTCGGLLQFAAVHLGAKQVNLLLGVMRGILTPTTLANGTTVLLFCDKPPTESSAEIQDCLLKVLAGLVRCFDITSLLSSAHFLPLLRLLDVTRRQKLSKAILSFLPEDASMFALVIRDLCSTLHETCVVLGSPAEVVTECELIIVGALRSVVSVRDPEQQLTLMAEARHTLANIDAVRSALVEQALRSVHVFGGQARKRSAAKAYLAFIHVTIPAAICVFRRLALTIEAASTAFLYGFVAQGEAILKLSTEFLKEVVARVERGDGVVESNSERIRDLVLRLVMIGAVAPSHAKYGHNYILQSLVAWNENFAWEPSSNGRAAVSGAILRVLSKGMVGGLPCLFPKCGTELYNKDEAYVESCAQLGGQVAENTVVWLRSIAKRSPPALVCSMALDLFETCALFGDGESSLAVRYAAAESWYLVNLCNPATDLALIKQIAVTAKAVEIAVGKATFAKLTDSASASAERKQQLEAESAAATQ